QVDENDVLGLIVVQARQDQLFQSSDTALGICGRFDTPAESGVQAFLRTGRSFTVQRGAPLMSSREGPYHNGSPRSVASRKLQTTRRFQTFRAARDNPRPLRICGFSPARGRRWSLRPAWPGG